MTIEQVAALAWGAVKDQDDPVFHLCHVDHRNKLTYHAQSVRDSGIAGDAFEAKVKEVLAEPAERLHPAPIQITDETTVASVSPDITEPEPADDHKQKRTTKAAKALTKKEK